MGLSFESLNVDRDFQDLRISRIMIPLMVKWRKLFKKVMKTNEGIILKIPKCLNQDFQDFQDCDSPRGEVAKAF
jgi:hypothetical protein